MERITSREVQGIRIVPFRKQGDRLIKIDPKEIKGTFSEQRKNGIVYLRMEIGDNREKLSVEQARTECGFTE